MKNQKAVIPILAIAFGLSYSALTFAAYEKGGHLNPPGPKGGVGHGPQHDLDNNPPGPRGGEGTNWENPAGPAGGPGASPDRPMHAWGPQHAGGKRK